jgi:hypothetical protein
MDLCDGGQVKTMGYILSDLLQNSGGGKGQLE